MKKQPAFQNRVTGEIKTPERLTRAEALIGVEYCGKVPYQHQYDADGNGPYNFPLWGLVFVDAETGQVD